MERFNGLAGIALILGIAVLLSNNRKAINLRLVFSGLALQLALAAFILKTAIGQMLFSWVGAKIKDLLAIADKGGEFVFGGLMRTDLSFAIAGRP